MEKYPITPNIKKLFKTIGGEYLNGWMNNETYQYMKEDITTIFLSRKVVGQWTISKYLNVETFIMFQRPFDWIWI